MGIGHKTPMLMAMEQTPIINIYLPEEVDTTSYPVSLSEGFDMSVDYKIEVSWTFYLMLEREGIPARICSDYPEKGILLIHKAFAERFVWKPDLFVVSMQWDYKRDDRGQVHLVSNKYKTHASSLGWLDRLTFPGLQYFLPLPMHPVLFPRSSERGGLFKTVAFIGAEKNLEAEFRTAEFKERVARLGMQFIIVDDPAKMMDYSEIDVILAVRNLKRQVSHKPAQKLINAWRGGVPSILGCEVGYRELKHSNLDYLEVGSSEGVIVALKRLRDDVEFRDVVVQNGLWKAKSYTLDEIQRRWAGLFRDKIIPAYGAWENRALLSRLAFLAVRRARSVLRVALSLVWHRLLGIKPKL